MAEHHTMKAAGAAVIATLPATRSFRAFLHPAKAQLHWTKLKLANRFGRVLDADQEARIKAMQDKAIAEIEANGIRLHATESTADNLKLQGDAEMLSKESLIKRSNLKRHPRVRAVITRFWDVVEMIKDENGNLGQSHYVEMNMRLSKSLVPNEGLRPEVMSEQEAVRSLSRRVNPILATIKFAK